MIHWCAVKFDSYPLCIGSISFKYSNDEFIWRQNGGIEILGCDLECLFVGDVIHIPSLLTCLVLLGKASVVSCFAILFLYTAELYPTIVRSIGSGTCMFMTRIGSLTAPQIRYLVSWTQTGHTGKVITAFINDTKGFDYFLK